MADPTRTKPNRRGRNVPKLSEGWTGLPSKGRQGRAPEPHVPFTDEGWQLWNRWWHSPMATQWLPTDVAGLSRLLALYEKFWSQGLNQSELSAIDRLEKNFGLSPEGRRALKWQIVEDEPQETVKPAGAYGHLQVVDEVG